MATEKTLKARLKLLYKTATEWAEAKDEILLKGEAGVHIDGQAVLIKIGDGVTTWENLPYIQAIASDVANWAKKESLEFSDLDEDFELALEQFINDKFDISGIEEEIEGLEIAAKETAEDGYFKTYFLKDKNGKQHGANINIPRDYLVKDASLEKVTEDGKPYDDAEVGDYYIDFVVNTADEADEKHIYIPLKALDINDYSGEKAIDVVDHKIVLKIDETNANGLNQGVDGLALALVSATQNGALSSADYLEFLNNRTVQNLQGPNGKAMVWNEKDGGGVKFEHNDGTWSFCGVNDGGANGITGQIYSVKKNAAGQWEGIRINMTNNGFYYFHGTSSTGYDEKDEIATLRNIENAIAAIGLAAIATTGNVNDLIQTIGDVLIIDGNG